MSGRVYIGNLSWDESSHSLATIDHYHTQNHYEGSRTSVSDPTKGGQLFGTVHEGEWMGRAVAVKTLKRETNDEKLEQGVTPWMHTHHPNVVPPPGVFSSGYCSPNMSINTPHLGTRNLNDFVAQNSGANHKALLIGIAQGLGHLHENNIVHGDLRGENIFIGDYGNVVLSDFGISNRVEPPEIGLGSSVASSLRWQAPECVLSTTGQDFAPQSDVWSFGCIAGELSTGRVPFANIPNAVGIVLAHHRRSPPFEFGRGGKTREGNDDYNRDIMHYLSPFCTYYDRSNRPSVTIILALLSGEENTVNPENRYHKTRARL